VARSKTVKKIAPLLNVNNSLIEYQRFFGVNRELRLIVVLNLWALSVISPSPSAGRAPKTASRWGRAANGRTSRRWKGRSRPSVGPTSIGRYATPQMRAQVSPTCGPAGPDSDPELIRLMVGRAAKPERLGLAEQVAPGCWTFKPGIQG
jgi:hypothetical protein